MLLIFICGWSASDRTRVAGAAASRDVRVIVTGAIALLPICNSRYCQRAAGEITIQQSKRHGGLAVESRRRLGVYYQVRVQTNTRV